MFFFISVVLAILLWSNWDEKKKTLEKINQANNILNEKNNILKEATLKATSMTQEAELIIKNANEQSAQTLKKYNEAKSELSIIQDQVEVLTSQSVVQAIDISCYDHLSSDETKNKLSMLTIKQADLIKSDKALIISSTEQTKKAINDNKKQILRCFNTECSHIISNLSVKTIDSARSKITKSFEVLNKLFQIDDIAISKQLLELKYAELSLVYAYEVKKEEEKEQQKFIREQLAEEEKVRKELEKQRQKIEKEETQFKNEIDKLMQYMQKSNDEIQSQLYVDKIKELEEKLKLLEKDKENILEREQNTRAGFVYIISNIGSFGEDIYKIGMTRRLEPMDRIKELGDASVPFTFDVHALVFSEDAPALENILHDTFREFEVNKINHRKEFFKVDLDEIKKIVLKNHNATVNFIDIPVADQYRESLKLANS